MKRFVAILLVLLFTANIGGAEITHHLCGKVFQYISLNGHKKDTKCCCKGGKVDKGCCKTKYFKVKIDRDQTLTKAYSPGKVASIEYLIPETPAIVTNHADLQAYVPSDIFIPQKVRWRPDDINILHCVYRI